MAEHKRTATNVAQKTDIGSGPYLARIISHLDPTFMGSLEVTLLRSQGNTIGEDSQTYVVKCASPFFGYTGFEFMGQNNAATKTLDGYNDTQKSYGMWMVPPDVGVTVMVVFVDGDPAQGYWIGCVPSRFSNNMVPAIGATTLVEMDPTDKAKYNTRQPLPVAEVNRRLNAKEDRDINVDKLPKPLHPIAEHFLEQGLLEDDVRGSTTSSSRREAPSMVFGISTPGPLDKRPGAKKSKIGGINTATVNPVPISRLGGTQFVMDDGDARYQRTTPAGVGPVNYADVLNGEKGEPTIPYNEYFRVRTRTGHQLLMHNSEDLIYIGNSRGTAWIELTSNGKIDIYAADSISIHTQNDLNIKADRDINLEAGRNVNIKASADYSGKQPTDSVGKESGRVQIESEFNTNVYIGKDGKITTRNDLDVLTGNDNRFTAERRTNIKSGENHIETATNIHMNGPQAAKARSLTRLSVHINPLTDITEGWPSKKYQKGTVESIMKRIPMHEPWLLHENQAPQFLRPTDTDRE